MIIAAAVASILAPATVLADTTLYGALRMSAVSGERNGADFGGVVNNASRIGIKGSYGEDGGLTGFFHVQMGADTDGTTSGVGLTSRFAFAGVKGGFGKVVMGRLSSPYKMAGLKVDPFYDTSAGTGHGGANFGLSSFTNGFLNNSIGYISPKLGGSVTINAVAFLDKDDETAMTAASDAIINAGGTAAAAAAAAAAVNAKNMFNVGATYSANGITASVQHMTEVEATRLAVGYKTGAFGVGLSYEDVQNANADTALNKDNGTDHLYLSGTYKVAPKTTLAASYGTQGAENSATADIDGYSLGVFHKVASKTTVSAIYSDVDTDTTTGSTGDRSVFAIGLVQKF